MLARRGHLPRSRQTGFDETGPAGSYRLIDGVRWPVLTGRGISPSSHPGDVPARADRSATASSAQPAGSGNGRSSGMRIVRDPAGPGHAARNFTRPCGDGYSKFGQKKRCCPAGASLSLAVGVSPRCRALPRQAQHGCQHPASVPGEFGPHLYDPPARALTTADF
jgi:hypothetical protein